MLRRKPPARLPLRLRTLTTQNPQTITSNDHIIRLPKRFGTNFQHDDLDLDKERRVQLERIAHGFRGVRWGMAYGSGVFEQVGYPAGSSSAAQERQAGKEGTISETSETKTREGKDQGPMLDFLLATTHPSHFHAINLSTNPTHYPLIWRWLGPHAIARVQEWGGGVWFVTDVHVPLPASSSSTASSTTTSTSSASATPDQPETVKIKYGIISLDTLCQDLLDWTHLYASGRMHKPIRIVRGGNTHGGGVRGGNTRGGGDKRVLVAAQVNLTSALRVALLRLGERFRERELWEEVAGLSYQGDPRMSIPGAENPHKVRNIVRPQIPRFRALYGTLLNEMGGVRADDERLMLRVGVEDVGGPGEEREGRVTAWRRVGLGLPDGEGVLRQDKSIQYRASLLAKLPRTLRRAIATHYCTQLDVQIISSNERVPKGGSRPVLGDEFWELVAKEEESGLREVLNRELKNIMHGPALRQSFKGLLTAGFRKSLVYAGRKVGKWWNSKASTGKQTTRAMSTGGYRRNTIGRTPRYQQIRHASNDTKILRDGKIPFKMVQLVSSEDNSLGPLQSLNSILRTYDPKTHYLQLVSNAPPIVRLMEKKAQQEKALGAEKKAKQKRARAIGRSEVQVTWESAQGDLTHKIGLIRNIIERGDRVDIAFIHKPANSGTLLSGAALKRVQERYPATVREELADVAKEFKPDTKDQRMTMMYLEPTKDIRDAVLKKMDATDEEKSKLKEAKKMERRLKEEERLRKAKAREDK